MKKLVVFAIAVFGILVNGCSVQKRVTEFKGKITGNTYIVTEDENGTKLEVLK